MREIFNIQSAKIYFLRPDIFTTRRKKKFYFYLKSYINDGYNLYSEE
jgi:hypothetical protein